MGNKSILTKAQGALLARLQAGHYLVTDQLGQHYVKDADGHIVDLANKKVVQALHQKHLVRVELETGRIRAVREAETYGLGEDAIRVDDLR